MARQFTLVFLSLAVVAEAGFAIITRDDVSPSAYTARAGLMPYYCQMMVPDGGGTLIAPHWVLTAAHLAPSIKPGHQFVCGRESLSVVTVVTHPAYDDAIGRHDIALVKLASASKQRPIALASQPVEVGTVVDLIGHYQGGTGLTGGVGSAPAGLRGATNRVSQADDRWLQMVMDRPGSRLVTPLEGVSGAGDSGAPAFVMRDGQPVVVGVGSRSSDSNDNGIEQDYGDTDRYVPVASYSAWIGRVTAGRQHQGWQLIDSLIEWRQWLGIAAALALGVCAMIGAVFVVRLKQRT